MTILAPEFEALRLVQPVRIAGRVATLRGLTVLIDELPVPVGSLVRFGRSRAGPPLFGEVVGFARDHSIAMLLGHTDGVRPGDLVTCEEVAQTAPVGTSLLGRVVNGLGMPIDSKGPLRDTVRRPLNPSPLSPMRRRPIRQMLQTGVRSIDLMTSLGRGQRMGLFAGPGVGKSTLLGTIAKRTDADVNVIALVGERGREVKDFIDHVLGEKGLARSVVVVATGDESALLRVRAAKLACTVAEFFRDEGRDVLLMMDSVTRFAHAARQIGLSVGEPPATKGYTPSVFASMALLLERAGCVESIRPGAHAGSITGLYTILVEGDDMTEPVSDAARGILDGHIVLSRPLAQRNHYPAVDVLDSVSRVADEVTDADHARARRQFLRFMAAYKSVEELVQIGAYVRGSSPEADVAIDHHAMMIDLLRQGRDDATPFEKARAELLRITKSQSDAMARPARPRA